MVVGIHQTQYIPWIPYFSKIKKSDIFVLMDDVQFQKNGLQNRNYLWSANGELRLTLSVVVHLGDKINEVKLFNKGECQKHFKTIEQTYKKAPFFAEVFPLIESPLSNNDGALVNIANPFIHNVVNYLGIKTKLVLSSQVNKSGVNSDLVLSICENLGASTYLSGSGGADYLKVEDFSRKNINVEYQAYNFKPYKQFNNKGEFVSKLSILDVLFNEGLNANEYI